MSDDLCPFDPMCPWCRKDSDPGERFDGEHYRCGSCGRPVVAVCYVDKDGNHDFAVDMVRREPHDERTGRQRTRARWSRQGRR